MSGGGSIAAMNASLKANERKRERVRYFDKKTPSYTKIEHKKLYSRELTKEERAKLKLKVRNSKIHHKNNIIMALAISIFMTFGVLFLAIYILKTVYFKS